jgi:hypothetical protein
VECLETLEKDAWKAKETYGIYFTCGEKTSNLMKMFGVRCVKMTSITVWRTTTMLQHSSYMGSCPYTVLT